MNDIVKIIMKRDGMTEEEAREYVDEVMEEVNDAIASGDYELAEDIFEGDLGLEIDYLLDAMI